MRTNHPDDPRCPGCNDAYQSQRQISRPNRCAWCGYNYETGEHARLVPASTSDEDDYFMTDNTSAAPTAEAADDGSELKFPRPVPRFTLAETAALPTVEVKLHTFQDMYGETYVSHTWFMVSRLSLGGLHGFQMATQMVSLPQPDMDWLAKEMEVEPGSQEHYDVAADQVRFNIQDQAAARGENVINIQVVVLSDYLIMPTRFPASVQNMVPGETEDFPQPTDQETPVNG